MRTEFDVRKKAQGVIVLACCFLSLFQMNRSQGTQGNLLPDRVNRVNVLVQLVTRPRLKSPVIGFCDLYTTHAVSQPTALFVYVRTAKARPKRARTAPVPGLTYPIIIRQDVSAFGVQVQGRAIYHENYTSCGQAMCAQQLYAQIMTKYCRPLA